MSPSIFKKSYERVINLCVQRSVSETNWETVAKRILILCQGDYRSELAKGEGGSENLGRGGRGWESPRKVILKGILAVKECWARRPLKPI